MVTVYSKELTPLQIDQVTGSILQIAGIRKFKFCDGFERGTSMLQMHNASNLTVDVLPDRCLDIGQVWFEGVPLAWIGPNGLPPKSRMASFDAAFGGLLTTCGFDHIRQPEEHNGTFYPMHGTLALEPGKITRSEVKISENDNALQIDGVVNAFSLKKGGVRLNRNIEVPLGENSIVVSDHIEVISSKPIALMGMYHFNFGFPLITDSAQLHIETSDKKEKIEVVDGVHIYALPPEEINIHLENRVGTKIIRVSLQFDGSDLPFLQTFGLLENGTNLFCLEPATHDRKPRDELEREGVLPLNGMGYVAKKKVKIIFKSC